MLATDACQSSNSDGFTLHLVLSLPGNHSSNTNPTVRDNPQIPHVNFPQPIGLPNLPGIPQGLFPRRPASTSQLPNGEPVPYSEGQHANSTPNAPQPQATTQRPFLDSAPNVRYHHQNFNAPPNFNNPPNPALGAHQFNMPFPGMPFPWVNGQNGAPQNVNTNHAITPNREQDQNIDAQRLNPNLNQSSIRRDGAQQTNEASSNSNEGRPTFQAPSAAGPTGHPNNSTPVGQWRISINQTTFHSGQPMQAGQMASGFLGQNAMTPTIQNMQRANLTNLSSPELRNHLQQLRNHASNITNAPRYQAQSSPATLAYLLSSPTGPQALLVSPAGSFASPGYGASIASPPLFGLPQQVLQQSGGTNIQPFPSQAQAQGVRPRAESAPADNRQPNPHQQLPQLQQQDQAGELLRILQPLGDHFWLLVRLCGFVYLFSSDRGWRNMFLLGFCAFIVFAAQTRIFEPLLQHVWNPIRRHVEALVQVDQPMPPAGQRQGNEPGPETGNPGSPQNMADRLTRERREQQNNNPFRMAFSRLERSIALFLASLIPGVGERHVAARQEATRQQREREEAAQREREEQERQRQEQASPHIEHQPTEGNAMVQAERVPQAPVVSRTD